MDLFATAFLSEGYSTAIRRYRLDCGYDQSDTSEDRRDLHAALGGARGQSPGLSPRAVLDKFAAIQMLDVYFPTTDGRTL